MYGAFSIHGKRKNVYNILTGKPYEGEHLEELGLW
jgi:hypothetical protein